jgi:hypothetical protein
MKKILLWGVVLSSSAWACQESPESPIEKGASFFEAALQLSKSHQVGIDMNQIGIQKDTITINEVAFNAIVKNQFPEKRINAFKKFCCFMKEKLKSAKLPVTTRELAFDFSDKNQPEARDFFTEYDALTEIAMHVAHSNGVKSSHTDMTEINKRA